METNRINIASLIEEAKQTGRLYLSNMGLKEIPPFLLDGDIFMRLSVLNLSGNLLTDVSALAGLSALTELDLQNNQLTEADIECLQPLIDRGCKVLY